jgi:threonine/homoserine/homoserine lactone efflux protein
MIEEILTLFIVGVIVGIIFSMPVAGPINIIIVSNALQGKVRFCTRTAIGASIVEFFYVFFVVYGIAALYSYYKSIIPYLILLGGFFVIIVSINLMWRRYDFASLTTDKIITDKMENKGGMRTGIFLNLTNPSLFISWLIVSFITLSFISSLGFTTGGLDIILNKNVKSVSEIAGPEFKDLENLNYNHKNNRATNSTDSIPIIFLSLVFAFSVSAGSLFWLIQMIKIIIRYRDKIKVQILNKLIQILGGILLFIGGYLIYQAIVIFSA